jgi:hypothetical protein
MEQRILTVRILWGAMLASILFYVVVLHMITIQPPLEPLNPAFPLVFACVGVSTAIASFIVPKVATRQALVRLKLPLAEVPDSNAPDAFKKTIRTFAHPEDAAFRAAGVFHTGFILSFALSEAVALLGFALAFLAYGWGTAAPFFVAGFLLIALRFPREETIISGLEHAYGVRFPATKP